MNLKNIIGKKVYSVYEGDTVGTVMSANFNNSFKKISSLIVFDDEDDEYCLPLSSVMAMGDGIIIKNRTKLRDLHEIRNIGIICKEVFDENAKNLGIIDDVEFDLQGNIEKYITNNKTELDPAFVIFRKGFILYSKNKIVISNLRPRKKNIDLKTIKVKVSTGDVTGTLVGDYQFDVDTSTGDRKYPKNSHSDTNTCYIRTSTGDVNISLV